MLHYSFSNNILESVVMDSKEVFVSYENDNKGFSMDKIVHAVRGSILANAEKESSFVRFAEIETDFDYDDYRNMLDAENERIEREEQRLSQRRKMIDGWRKGVDLYRDALFAAYQELDRRQKRIEDLHQQLIEEQKKREKESRVNESLMDISKKNAELTIQLTEQRALFEMTARQLADEKRQKADLEMNLAETRKLMDSIAKKSSEEGVQKAIQTFVNYSKRKTSDKRAYIKTTLLEFTSVNRISLPEEVSATIDCLDDEQTEPKVQIKEYVAQKLVDTEVQNVEAGATGIVKEIRK